MLVLTFLPVAFFRYLKKNVTVFLPQPDVFKNPFALVLCFSHVEEYYKFHAERLITKGSMCYSQRLGTIRKQQSIYYHKKLTLAIKFSPRRSFQKKFTRPINKS